MHRNKERPPSATGNRRLSQLRQVLSLEAIVIGIATAFATYLLLGYAGFGSNEVPESAVRPTAGTAGSPVWAIVSGNVASLVGTSAAAAWSIWSTGKTGALNPLVCWAASSILFMILISEHDGGPILQMVAAQPPR